MRFERGITACAILICIAFAPARGQGNDSYEFVRADLHLEGAAEYRGDWATAKSYCRKIIDESVTLPLDVREWFRGTTGYLLARCAARLKDTTTTHTSLEYAFRHHFWNSSLIQLDSSIVAICGTVWLDSISRFWGSICAQERPNWHEQPPYVFYPSGYDSTARWPLIIAMHGGNANYENFSGYWHSMASELKAVVAVPPGVLRESEITNSWGGKMEVIEPAILDLVKRFTSQHMVDDSKIYLAGFSQGAQASIELSLRHPEIFQGAIAMAGFVSQSFTDSALAVAHQQGLRIYAITGESEDPTFRAQIQQIHDQCIRAEIPFELSIVPGMIHEVPLDFRSRFLTAWEWVRLAQEANGQGTH